VITRARAGVRRLATAATALAMACSLAAPTQAEPGRAEPVEARPAVHQVLAISVDGLNVRALRRLGRAGAPHLIRLLRQGASTRNARTQVEMTVTLPNHTSMLTGRRIDAAEGGHGVDWNYDRPRTTVQRAAGGSVASIFTRVHKAGGRTALFATESKFSLFERSWPRAINRSTIVQDGDAAVTRAVRRDLLRHRRAFTFLHLGAPDEAGHAHRWLSAAYLEAVRQVDRHVGVLLDTITAHPRRLGDLVIVLTSDHGDARILFDGPQPIRNGDLANLSASLLGLRPVPGSLWDADQSMTWHD
jgi:predicted AlkP superfamily pyrophosphatase or phosphodiesterase